MKHIVLWGQARLKAARIEVCPPHRSEADFDPLDGDKTNQSIDPDREPEFTEPPEVTRNDAFKPRSNGRGPP